MTLPVEWFAAHTDSAPPVLRDRAARYFAAAGGADLGDRLASAARRALDAAITAGVGRAAALDLLAADALITLALVANAERCPARLAAAAASLRASMAAA